MTTSGALENAKPVVIVCTRDRAVSTPFYRDVLGLKLTSEDPFAAVFDIGGAPLRLSNVGDWKAHEHTVFGFAVSDLTATAKALSKKGVSFTIYPGFGQDELGVWTSPDKAVRVAWFNDPDGNVLSITEFSKK